MIVFTESWDHYGTADPTLITDGKWTSIPASNNSLVAGGGRCGTTAYRNNSSGSLGPSVGLVLGDQFSWGQVPIFRESIATGQNDISFGEAGGDTQCFFRFMADGSVQFWQGPSTVLGNLLATSAPGKYSINAYYVFEWEVLVDPAVGTVQAWIDGDEIIPLTTGLDTEADPAFVTQGPYTMITVACVNAYKLDSCLFGDGVDSGVVGRPNNKHLGPKFVSALFPESDILAGAGGFYKEFTPSTGSDHGILVGENPPDAGASRVDSASATKKDTFTYPDIKIATGEIYAVNVLPMVMKSDAMNTRKIKPCS